MIRRYSDSSIANVRTTDGTIVGSPARRIDPFPLAWRNVAFQPRISASLTTAKDSRTDTVTLTVCRDVTELRLSYHTMTGLLAYTTTPVTYAATINGHPVTFGGQATGTAEPGGIITSDPLPLVAAAGTKIDVTTTATGVVVPVAYGGAVMPWAVSGQSARASLLVIGDSITAIPPEWGDGFADAGIPTTLFGASGGRANHFSDAILDACGIRADGAHGYTHALIEMGINADSGSLTRQTAQQSLDLARRLRARGIKHITQTVPTPHKNSTDGWKTLEGQSDVLAGQATKGPDRDPAAAWLRRGAPVSPTSGGPDIGCRAKGMIYVGDPDHPFTEVLDWGRNFQAGPESPLWRVDQAAPITTDGTHLTPDGYALGRSTISAWAARINRHAGYLA